MSVFFVFFAAVCWLIGTVSLFAAQGDQEDFSQKRKYTVPPVCIIKAWQEDTNGEGVFTYEGQLSEFLTENNPFDNRSLRTHTPLRFHQISIHREKGYILFHYDMGGGHFSALKTIFPDGFIVQKDSDTSRVLRRRRTTVDDPENIKIYY